MKVTSYELSKRLHDAGIVVESEKWWSYVSCGDGCSHQSHVRGGWAVTWKAESHDAIPAPDCSELLMFLPTHCENGRNLTLSTEGDKWSAFYYGHRMGDLFLNIEDSPAEALAKLALSLRKAGVI